ncbi:MAG: Na/Pi cotransporter family protein [Faecalibacterium sp.]|nr:Na/Pi cotransporter family protein [Faecalibacterium sp.]
MEQGFQVLLQVFGGLALFLYGTDSLCRAVQQGAGRRLRSLLARCTANPVAGLLTGAAVTAVLQSSSAVTVMVLGFVSAGLLTLRQAVPVIFGCNIGTTVTAQLLAFRLEDVRGLVLLAGLLLCFACAGQKARAVGRAVFAFGLLFEGIAGMSTALAPLAQSPIFALWLARVRHHPWLGLLTGLCMTLTVQSSSATIAVLQSVAARPGPQGGSLLGLAGALPVLLGDNIGTTVTAVLASIGQSRDTKRAAAAHALFNLTGAAAFCALLPWYAGLVAMISPKGPELEVIARQLANAHTLFNLICTAVWLPLTPLMVRLVCRLVPDRPPKARNS